MRGHWLSFAMCALAFTACNPYERFVGDSNAGAVDPVNFPAAYLGAGGVGKTPGMGKMMALVASVAGAPTAYYTFPFTGADLSLATDGVISAPLAYDFDEDKTTHCVAPDNYVYDQQRDAVRYNEQGDIFTALPDSKAFPTYQPVVADVVVHSQGLPCQDVKSEITVVARKDVSLALVPAANPNEPDSHATGKPSGVYYARPIVDPSVDIHLPDGSLDPNTGLGPQKWGWYQRYLLAYLDGGAIPTLDADVTNMGGQVQHVTQMIAQAIFFPVQHPGTDSMGNVVPVPGALGDGYDVLTADRGQTGASPLCQAFSFIPLDPMSPETDVAAIDMSTAQPATDTNGNPLYVWCIQVAK